ncbi:MAG TPA: GNAT family N-acetyltransferase, partial [Flavisolibacter sp.]|nr:GNAT family N-acetyltransferase [Flavisolibacter sp.]
RQTFEETFAADNTEEDMKKFLGEQFTLGKLMLEVGISENTFLLAYDNDKLAGYVKLRDGKAPLELEKYTILEIARIYATKDYIGKGVGNFLMQASINMAKQKNKQVVWLGVWEKNERAIKFYQKWGFEKFSDTIFLLGDDIQNDWLMKKFL